MICSAVAQLIDPPCTVTVSLGIAEGGPPPLAMTLPHVRTFADAPALADCPRTPTTQATQAIATRLERGRRIDGRHLIGTSRTTQPT
jgi:hypothetical protein